MFKLVYRDKTVVGQWLISKIIPVHKKVTKSVLKIIDQWLTCALFQRFFEKLILKQIHELESINGICVGGKQQHYFSTFTITMFYYELHMSFFFFFHYIFQTIRTYLP